MSLNRSEKQVVIDEVSALAAKAQTLVMAEYRGITVAALTQLRVAARSQGVSLSVLKNTLARRAVAGTGFEAGVDQMTGPLIYGFSEDAVAAAKVVADFAKTNDKMVIRGGVYAGKSLDVATQYLNRLEIAHKVSVKDGAFTTTDLSTGQRKRLALVNAWLEERPVLVFDEWAADQDPAFRRIFYTELLPDLKRLGKTIIVISHDDRYFDIADQLVRMKAGRVLTELQPA